MAKKKVLKSTQTKLNNAVTTLQNFSKSAVEGNDIILNGMFLVNDTDTPINLTILFNNIAIGTSSDILLNTSPVIPPKFVGSVKDLTIASNKNAAGNFLNIFSAVLATNLTPVPDDLKVEISLTNGVSTVSYPLPSFKLNSVGDRANLSISIFFLRM